MQQNGSPVCRALTLAGLLLAVLVAAPLPPDTWTRGHPVAWAFAYPLFHANFFHLATNVWIFWQLDRAREIRRGEALSAWLIAALVSFVPGRPCVGLSAFLYAVMGLRAPGFRHLWWRSRNAAVFLGAMALTLPFPWIATLPHIGAFFGGVLAGQFARLLKETTNDYTKAK